MTRWKLFVSTALSAAILAAIGAAQAQLSFEVVSIKRNLAGGPGPRSVTWPPGGQMRATALTVKELVRSAYVYDGIQVLEQIVGGPDWIGSDRFDIVAKIPEMPNAAPVEANQHRSAMLKGLLAERFGLSVHRDTQVLPVFDLVLANDDGKLGPQLAMSTCMRTVPSPSATATGGSRRCVPSRLIGMEPGKGMTMGFEGMTMPEFAAALVSFPDIGRPIRDRTGLTGAFDLQLTIPMAAGPGAAGTSRNPGGGPIDTGILTALREQLGLKLESRRDQLDVIVIDTVKPPTED